MPSSPFLFLPGPGEASPWSEPPALTAGGKSTYGHAAEQEGHSLHPSDHPCAVFCPSGKSCSSLPDEWGKWLRGEWVVPCSTARPPHIISELSLFSQFLPAPNPSLAQWAHTVSSSLGSCSSMACLCSVSPGEPAAYLSLVVPACLVLYLPCLSPLLSS